MLTKQPARATPPMRSPLPPRMCVRMRMRTQAHAGTLSSRGPCSVPRPFRGPPAGARPEHRRGEGEAEGEEGEERGGARRAPALPAARQAPPAAGRREAGALLRCGRPTSKPPECLDVALGPF